MTKANILVVEDEAITAMGIKATLKNLGHNVLDTVSSGEEAIRKIAEVCPDLVLMDIELSGEMNGIEAAGQIQKLFNIPVVYLTAHTDDTTLQEAKITESYGYIVKPFEGKNLGIVVEMALCRHKGEDKIRKLSHAVEYSPVTIMITDTKGNIEYVNPKFTKLTDYSIEEAIGKNPSFLSSGKITQEEYKRLWDTITSGEEWSGDFCNKKKNGELYWESASISPVKSDGGVITNFIAVKEDTTGRKQSERRLKAQHEVTQVLAESNTIKEASPKILQAVCEALEWDIGEIWVYDQQQCTLRNTEIWHLPSLKFSEFKAVTIHTTFSPQIGLPGRVWESVEPLWIEDVVHDPNFLRASIADKVGIHGAFGFPIIIGSEVLGTICFFSCEIRKPDKDLLDMMTAIGRQIGLFIKRKQAEEALLRSEKLKSLGTITAGVSHEFNNILAIISGNAQLLEGSRKDDKELMEALRTIMRAANDGAQISGRMLKFTKTAKDTAGFAPFDINELINQAFDFTMPRWKNMAQAKGINYHMDTEGMKRVPSILCNPAELREVFVNIINNALDAMPDGGTITVATRCLRPPARPGSAVRTGTYSGRE